MRISATYKDGQGDKATAELMAVAFYSANEMYVHVGTSTEQGRLGENAVIHLRSNFGFQVYSYVVSCRCVIHLIPLIKFKFDLADCVQRFGHLRGN